MFSILILYLSVIVKDMLPSDLSTASSLAMNLMAREQKVVRLKGGVWVEVEGGWSPPPRFWYSQVSRLLSVPRDRAWLSSWGAGAGCSGWGGVAVARPGGGVSQGLVMG